MKNLNYNEMFEYAKGERAKGVSREVAIQRTLSRFGVPSLQRRGAYRALCAMFGRLAHRSSQQAFQFNGSESHT